MITLKDICNKYELFFIKVSGYVNYSFKPTLQQIKQIDNFIKLLDLNYNLKTIDDKFLMDYFAYQFQKRSNQKTRFGEGIVMLNWIIGKKAFECWLNKEDNWYYFSNLFLDKHQIRRVERQIKNVLNLNKSEEDNKNQYYNTLNGFLYCVENTTLFNNKSKYCIACKNNLKCKLLLKQQYPNIYKKRFFVTK